MIPQAASQSSLHDAGHRTARHHWPVAGFLLAACLLAGLAGEALAQAPAQPPVAKPVQTISWLDAGIFAVLAGGALFAVCRSSNRM
jgi:hypothetical protein